MEDSISPFLGLGLGGISLVVEYEPRHVPPEGSEDVMTQLTTSKYHI